MERVGDEGGSFTGRLGRKKREDGGFIRDVVGVQGKKDFGSGHPNLTRSDV